MAQYHTMGNKVGRYLGTEEPHFPCPRSGRPVPGYLGTWGGGGRGPPACLPAHHCWARLGELDPCQSRSLGNLYLIPSGRDVIIGRCSSSWWGTGMRGLRGLCISIYGGHMHMCVSVCVCTLVPGSSPARLCSGDHGKILPSRLLVHV